MDNDEGAKDSGGDDGEQEGTRVRAAPTCVIGDPTSRYGGWHAESSGAFTRSIRGANTRVSVSVVSTRADYRGRMSPPPENQGLRTLAPTFCAA